MRRKGVRLLYSESLSIGLIWLTATEEQNKYFHNRDSLPIEQKRIFVLYYVILCYAMLSEKSCDQFGGGGSIFMPCFILPYDMLFNLALAFLPLRTLPLSILCFAFGLYSLSYYTSLCLAFFPCLVVLPLPCIP